jgi:hypothetical protein
MEPSASGECEVMETVTTSLWQAATPSTQWVVSVFLLFMGAVLCMGSKEPCWRKYR